jgi:hypothetical protein
MTNIKTRFGLLVAVPQEVEMKRATARLAAVALSSVLVFAAGAASATASTSPTPNGFCGAANMLVAWDTGMALAMSRDNPNGNIGMFRAVALSDC